MTNSSANGNEHPLVIVGSYAEWESTGIYVFELDGGTGALQLLESISGLKNPSFLEVDTKRNVVYAIEEVASVDIAGNAKGSGGVVALRIDPETGGLSLINRCNSTSLSTSHIKLDQSGRYLAVASYSGSQVGLLTVESDGSIGELVDVQTQSGSGINRERQLQSHPHSSFFDPSDKYVWVPDLGSDKIVAYRLNRDKNTLIRHGHTAASPGAGPRHLAIHPNGQFVYCINELNSTITAYQYELSESGLLRELAAYPTLPEEYSEPSITAEIRITPDGAFLYGSNRGHDSIACFSIDEATGLLTRVAIVPSGGGHPRNFGISPDGNFLLAANRDSDNIVSFRIDRSTGNLTPTGYEASVSKPVCVQIHMI